MFAEFHSLGTMANLALLSGGLALWQGYLRQAAAFPSFFYPGTVLIRIFSEQAKRCVAAVGEFSHPSSPVIPEVA